MTLSNEEVINLRNFLFEIGYISYEFHYPIVELSTRLDLEVEEIRLRQNTYNLKGEMSDPTNQL